MEDSRYQNKIRELRQHLPNPDACLYVLHTPLGAIQVEKWDYRIAGHVTVYGIDENRKFRAILFTEDAAMAFPVEVKLKDQSDAEAPGELSPSPIDPKAEDLA